MLTDVGVGIGVSGGSCWSGESGGEVKGRGREAASSKVVVDVAVT
jgi:hypothetical protein